MKFTRGICRLLGFGSDGPCQEDIEDQAGAPDLTDGRKDQSSSQAMLNHEEGLGNDQRVKRKAERRRAKRKRQRERRKQAREGKLEDASENEEESGAVSESDGAEDLTGAVQRSAVHPRNSIASVSALMTTENKSSYQLSPKPSEEEPEWDVSSAFVANAASHIKFKGLKSSAVKFSRENKENEARSSQAGKTQEVMRRGQSLTVQGIRMVEQGRYSQAVDMFTGAIYCNPKDHRFYGNRSYCYLCLEQYSCALTDAQRSIKLSPDWPKGYFRKGCALMGLKRYSEAEKAMEQVLQLDQQCKEASSKMFTCRILQLMEMGFEEEQSKELLEKFTTVQAVIMSSEAKALKNMSLQDQSGSCRSLWVGNITFEVTEKDLLDLFKTFGEIDSIRVLHERFCAFINFKNANMAATALEKLQEVELGNRKLVLRYPDRWIQRTLPSIQRTNTGLSPSAPGTQQNSAPTGSNWRTPLNGDECFYWRTTGCCYRDRCRFKHRPGQQGRDNNR